MTKDWTGSTLSPVLTHGASNHSDQEREENDFYATDPKTMRDLLAVEDFAQNIWECACGTGHLSKVLEEHEHTVISTDLIDRGYGIGGVDFLAETTLRAPDIITNPPYKYAQEFVTHSMDLGARKCAMFLKLTFLEGKKRVALFDKYPPKTVYVYSTRQVCAMNGDFEATKGSAVAYAWFVWESGFTGDPTIKWIKD